MIKVEPPRNEDLHGNVPDQSSVALLLIDVINTLDFPGNEEIVECVIPMARRIAALRDRAAACGIPTIYINDIRLTQLNVDLGRNHA